MDLCQTLGLPALAEGVESNAQVEALRGLRCGLGQGFYLSRPLTASSATSLVDQGPSLGRYVEEPYGGRATPAGTTGGNRSPGLQPERKR